MGSVSSAEQNRIRLNANETHSSSRNFGNRSFRIREIRPRTPRARKVEERSSTKLDRTRPKSRDVKATSPPQSPPSPDAETIPPKQVSNTAESQSTPKVEWSVDSISTVPVTNPKTKDNDNEKKEAQEKNVDLIAREKTPTQEYSSPSPVNNHGGRAICVSPPVQDSDFQLSGTSESQSSTVVASNVHDKKDPTIPLSSPQQGREDEESEVTKSNNNNESMEAHEQNINPLEQVSDIPETQLLSPVVVNNDDNSNPVGLLPPQEQEQKEPKVINSSINDRQPAQDSDLLVLPQRLSRTSESPSPTAVDNNDHDKNNPTTPLPSPQQGQEDEESEVTKSNNNNESMEAHEQNLNPLKQVSGIPETQLLSPVVVNNDDVNRNSVGFLPPQEQEQKEPKVINSSINDRQTKQNTIISQLQQKKIILKKQQECILLLRHAANCPIDQDDHCSVTPLCAEMKKLWQHINKCSDTECQVSQCISSRHILSHYLSCNIDTCEICSPVRATQVNVNSQERPAPKFKNISFGYSQSTISSVTLDIPSPSGRPQYSRTPLRSPQQEREDKESEVTKSNNNNESMEAHEQNINPLKQVSGIPETQLLSHVVVDDNENSDPAAFLPPQEQEQEEPKVINSSINDRQTQQNTIISQLQQKKIILKKQQERILLLRHAANCPIEHDDHCPVTPVCGEMKKLWQHINTCSDTECQVPQCISSRYILSHYLSCIIDTCEICSPVRATKVNENNQERPSPRFKNISFGYSQSTISSVTLDIPSPSGPPQFLRTNLPGGGYSQNTISSVTLNMPSTSGLPQYSCANLPIEEE